MYLNHGKVDGMEGFQLNALDERSQNPKPLFKVLSLTALTKFITTRLQDNQDEDLKTLTVLSCVLSQFFHFLKFRHSSSFLKNHFSSIFITIFHYKNKQGTYSFHISGPINCLWSGFGEWSRCSVSCGTGTQQRKRMVLQKAKNGGLQCRGDAIETRPCSQPDCPGM